MKLFQPNIPALALCLLPMAVFAAPESLNYNVVSLQAQVHREVENDSFYAVLFVEANDADPARLANGINRRLEEARRIAQGYGVVKVKTQSQQTFPIYNNQNKLQGWRARAEIRLESEDFPAATQLVGKLQGVLQLAQVGFSVSEKRRQQVENELTSEAIASFRQRADLVSRALGGSKGYRIVNLNVESGGGPGPRPMFKMAMAEAATADAAPVFQPGESQVSVNVNGSVQVNE